MMGIWVDVVLIQERLLTAPSGTSPPPNCPDLPHRIERLVLRRLLR